MDTPLYASLPPCARRPQPAAQLRDRDPASQVVRAKLDPDRGRRVARDGWSLRPRKTPRGRPGRREKQRLVIAPTRQAGSVRRSSTRVVVVSTRQAGSSGEARPLAGSPLMFGLPTRAAEPTPRGRVVPGRSGTYWPE